MKTLKNIFLNPQVFGSLLILILGLLTLRKNLFTPAIFGDDWIWYVKLPLEGGLTCPEISPRYLLNCLPALQYALFGLDFNAHRMVAVLLSLLVVVALYLLLNQMFPHYQLLNLGVSLLVLFFPLNNYAQFSIIYAYANLGFLFLFLAYTALIYFQRVKKWSAWQAAMVFFILTLGLYEAVVGLVIIGSLGLFLLSIRMEWKYKVAILAPALLGIGFTLLRLIYQLNVGSTYGHPTDQLVLEPRELIWRMYLGIRYLMHWSWTNPLLIIFPFLVTPGGHANLMVTLLALGFFVILVIVVALLGRREFFQKISVKLEAYFQSNFATPARDILLIFLTGLLVMVGGFFPSLLAIFPMGRFEAARIYFLPSIGACLILGLVLWLVGRGISQLSIKSRDLAALAFLVLLTPFVLYGMFIKNTVGENFQKAWVAQKAIWYQFFQSVPDFAPGTYVVLLMPNFETMMVVPPLQAGYDSFEFALSSLYGGRELIGAIPEANLESLVYTRDGLIVDPVNFPVTMPYERVLMFQFDESNNELQQIEAIPAGVIAEFPDGKALCVSCILQQPAQNTDLRWLVEP